MIKIEEITKRSGERVPFNEKKITIAMQKAMDASNVTYNAEILDKLTVYALTRLEFIGRRKGEITVEDANDCAEDALMTYETTRAAAKAFILYRDRHKTARNITKDVEAFAINIVKGSLGTASMDTTEASDPCKELDIIRNQNASTAGGTIGAAILQMSEAVSKLFWESVYDEEINQYSQIGEKNLMYIHDMGMIAGYCAGWSLKDLLLKGLGCVPNKIASAPPKHLVTVCTQLVNFLGIMQNEWAGAQAVSSFDTYLAPFVKADNLDYVQTKQAIQIFVFGVNVSSRWGSQCPFTNITLDWTVPEDMASQKAIVGGREMDFTYGECQREMDLINKAFLETMIAGDANGRGFQYPIPTYSITKEFDWSDTENNRLLFEMAAKYGTPYFSNYINSDMNPSDVRSMAILGTQNLIYKDKYGRISKNEVRHLVGLWLKDSNRGYSVLMNGKFVNVIDMFKVPYEKYDNYVSIDMAHGQTQKFSYDHKCVAVRDGQITEVLAQDLKAGDKFLLARHGYDESNIGTYEAGRIVGYYLAEGWKNHKEQELDFAINEERQDICEAIKTFFEKNFAARVTIAPVVNHARKVQVYSEGAVSFVSQFITGEDATEKHIEVAAYDTSLDFRRGIYDGYYETDGCKKAKNFAHTTNKRLCLDMIDLFATIGKYFKFEVNNHNTRYFKTDKSDLETFTSYKLKEFNPEVFDDDYYVVDVKAINLVDASRTNTVYNFTVNTAEHIYELPNGVITHQCCRLRLDLRELRKQNGGNFGAGENTGSIGVVTVDLPQIAYISKTEDEFFKTLEKVMSVAARSLDIKRRVVNQYLERGAYPYTKAYLTAGFKNHFSTIGLVGMNEACLNAKWVGKDLTNEVSLKWAEKVLDFMREKLSDFQEQYGCLFNLEATPAESTCYTLARKDKTKYPDIITAGEPGETPYYTNSSHLPVASTEDIFDALDKEDNLQTKYTSGTVFHAFLGERLQGWETAAKLVRTVAENYRLPYFTLSPTYSICKNHGYINGEVEACPHCGEKTEIYSRITGYYRPVSSWNDGKSQEFADRNPYSSFRKIDVKAGKTEKVETLKTPVVEDPVSETPVAETLSSGTPILLVKESGCPKCLQAEAALKKSGKNIKVIPVGTEGEGLDLAIEHNVMSAPALITKEGVIRSFNDVMSYIQ